MKTIVSNELKLRLTNAAYNGSVIAADILKELKENKDVTNTIRGTANFFSTKKIKSSTSIPLKMRIVFTACTKDLTNENFPDHNNPEAPWFKENRQDVEPSTFIAYFKNLPDYSDEEKQYFANVICVNGKVEVKVYDRMEHIAEGYDGENYAPIAQSGESTLHNSCMRHDYLYSHVADFYHHFAGAKIIIAKDSEGYILGRAMLWENAVRMLHGTPVELSVLDRVYYTHSSVMKMIHDYAEKIGINLRKKRNDACTERLFVLMNTTEALPDAQVGATIQDLTLSIRVPASKWHKKGAPYVDTFKYLNVIDNGELELSNYQTDKNIAECENTSGVATSKRCYCPGCGKVFYGPEALCPECLDKYSKQTLFGRIFQGKTTEYNGAEYPAFMFAKGKPTSQLATYLQIQKLY
ncbi:hypothetical protein [Bacteroides fragilis]|uniref:hypothetical protein n=1 Tax=Bacteroides thetaiotaomicron TaxID=818 RepID=UPI0029D7822C|nr:hypothetical protein [Bacteroides fragilis]MCE8655304.1 hypothetical protein [Bacteroides fragilis]